MSDEITAKETTNDKCSPCEKGTSNLLIGTGFGAYGGSLVLSAGYICPFCIIATPLFLGLGAVQRYKYLKNKQNSEKSESKETP